MIGAILGDLIGTPYEGSLFNSANGKLLEHDCDFSDDTILTCAVADSILNRKDAAICLREWTLRYPSRGYGGRYYAWALDVNAENGDSWSNGCTMRISALSLLCSDEDMAETAYQITSLTHNCEESYRAVECYLKALVTAKRHKDARTIIRVMDLNQMYVKSVDEYVEKQYFDSSCTDSVPKAIAAAIEADSFESAMRNCIKIGGDIDTLCTMAGAIAEYLYGVPEEYILWGWELLPSEIQEIVLSEYDMNSISELVAKLKPMPATQVHDEESIKIEKGILNKLKNFFISNPEDAL